MVPSAPVVKLPCPLAGRPVFDRANEPSKTHPVVVGSVKVDPEASTLRRMSELVPLVPVIEIVRSKWFASPSEAAAIVHVTELPAAPTYFSVATRMVVPPFTRFAVALAAALPTARTIRRSYQPFFSSARYPEPVRVIPGGAIVNARSPMFVG